MREADRKRERLLKTRCVSAATNHSGNSGNVTNAVKPVGGESKETKKIRDTNNTTSMLVVVITVRFIIDKYKVQKIFLQRLRYKNLKKYYILL